MPDDDQDAGASQDASATDAGTPPPGDGGADPGGTDDTSACARGGTDADDTNTVGSSSCTIDFQPASPVACPGMDCPITAIPSIPGGTFSWSVDSGATLLDASSGGAPSDSTNAITLRSVFTPDNSGGTIPAQTVNITLQYTPPGADPVPATLAVNVHGITFDVAGLDGGDVLAGTTVADETSVMDNVVLQPPGGGHTLDVLQTCMVTANVDPSCTASGTCAGNYQLGWLQTMTGNTRHIRYSDEDVQQNIPVPIQDARVDVATVPPFYSPPMQMVAGTSNSMSYFDCVQFMVPWTAPDSAANQLRQIDLAGAFTTWLVVQNINWATANPTSAFVFLRNFSWSLSMSVKVDYGRPTSPAVGKCCSSTPNPCTTQITSPPSAGQGSTSPVLTGQIADYAVHSPGNTVASPATHLP